MHQQNPYLLQPGVLTRPRLFKSFTRTNLKGLDAFAEAPSIAPRAVVRNTPAPETDPLDGDGVDSDRKCDSDSDRS